MYRPWVLTCYVVAPGMEEDKPMGQIAYGA